jgi:UDP-glucuronate 4-epimerase
MQRDFTYIDDIVEGVIRVMDTVPGKQVSPFSAVEAPYRLFNIGNNKPVELGVFISAIEAACNREAVKNFMPMQPGDVLTTYADIDDLKASVDFQPNTPIEEGIRKFVSWYMAKHDIKI